MVATVTDIDPGVPLISVDVDSNLRFTWTPADPLYGTLVAGGEEQRVYMPGSVDTTESVDHSDRYMGHEQTVDGLTVTYASLNWESKTIRISSDEGRLRFGYHVVGFGRITATRYFKGLLSAPELLNSRIRHLNDKKQPAYDELRVAGASPVWHRIWTPEFTASAIWTSNANEPARVSCSGDLDYRGGNFQSSPPPFVVCAWSGLGRAVAFAVRAVHGEHHFSEFGYDGGQHFGITVQSWGTRASAGAWTSAQVEIWNVADEWEAIRSYCATYPNRVPSRGERPTWWSGPIFDGWGQQCYVADIFHVRTAAEVDRTRAAYEASTQANYELWVDHIIGAGLRPAIVTVGARWASTGGLKEMDLGRWPDPAGFVRRMRDRGVRPILWWDPFEPSGFDDGDCVRWHGGDWADGNQAIDGRTTKFGLDSGAKIAPDYTLPRVRNFVRQRLAALFGTSGTGFAGVKLDHLAAVPALPGLAFPPASAELAGLEYLHYVIKFLSSELRRLDPMALIIGEASHPYVSGFFDMITIGDLYTPTRDVRQEANRRAGVLSAAAPQALIEMNGWPLADIAELDRYAPLQRERGVPALYYATHLDTTGEGIGDNRLAQLGQVWAQP